MTLAFLASLAALGPVQLAAIAAPSAIQPSEPPACIKMNVERLPLDKRQSPLDSIAFKVGKADVKVCYGRPSLRGRKMIGGEAVPYGKIWRTGANEPTMIHTTGPITVAGLMLPAGSYSLYTIPGPSEWQVIINRSISQWGHESAYSEEVRKQELGRAPVKAEQLPSTVEQFTIRAEPGGEASALVLEWETTRVRIPLGK